MQQKTLCVSSCTLFSVEPNGKSTARGDCACALVGLPTRPPKYSIVCYNSSASTLCVARLEAQNVRSANVLVQRNGYVDFTDDAGQRWSTLFKKEVQRGNFLAHLGLAFYVLQGQPQYAAVAVGLSPQDAGLPLGLQHRAQVLYTAYSTTVEADGLPGLGAMVEESGSDRPYAFTPVPSVATLPSGAKGFEGHVVGMTEGAVRSVVVPHDIPAVPSDNILAKQSALPTVFVLTLARLQIVDDSAADGAPSVFAHDGMSMALTLPAAAPERNGWHGSGRGDYPLAAAAASDYTPAISEGAGVPVEHMSLIQKVSAGVSAATSSVRDLRDTVVGVAADWKNAVDRPQPTALSHAVLLEQMQVLIADHERVAAEVAREDGLRRSLDTDNTELQRRVDAVARECQELLDGKSRLRSTISEHKLERTRELVRLQQQLESVTVAREDINRHLDAAKRLLEVTQGELRQVRGRREVNDVHAATTTEKLTTTRASLQETQQQRLALEARVALLQGEVVQGQIALRNQAAQLDAVDRQADTERDGRVALMQDERRQRETESAQLRGDIVHELQGREIRYRAEQSRVEEEQFYRGREEGRATGKAAAAEDVATHQSSLELEVRRAESALQTCKEELRQCVQDAAGSRRALTEALQDLQREASDGAREKVRLEQAIARGRDPRLSGREGVLRQLADLGQRLDHPSTPRQLLSVVAAMQRGDRFIDLSFNLKNWQTTIQELHQKRAVYVHGLLCDIYAKGASYYLAEWQKPLEEAHRHVVAQVRQLWCQRYGEDHYRVCMSERVQRSAIAAEYDGFLAQLQAWRDALADAREALWREAEVALAAEWAAYQEEVQLLQRACEEQLRCRAELQMAETAARVSLSLEEASARARLPEVFAQRCRQIQYDAQALVIGEEELERSAAVADECAQRGGIEYYAAKAWEAAVVATERSLARWAVETEEYAGRAQVGREQTEAFQQLAVLWAQLMAPPPPRLTATEVEPPRPVRALPPPLLPARVAPPPVAAEPSRPAAAAPPLPPRASPRAEEAPALPDFDATEPPPLPDGPQTPPPEEEEPEAAPSAAAARGGRTRTPASKDPLDSICESVTPMFRSEVRTPEHRVAPADMITTDTQHREAPPDLDGPALSSASSSSSGPSPPIAAAKPRSPPPPALPPRAAPAAPKTKAPMPTKHADAHPPPRAPASPPPPTKQDLFGDSDDDSDREKRTRKAAPAKKSKKAKSPAKLKPKLFYSDDDDN